MNIPDEASRRFPALQPDDEELTYPRSVLRGFQRVAFEQGAEWGRKEALREAARWLSPYPAAASVIRTLADGGN